MNKQIKREIYVWFSIFVILIVLTALTNLPIIMIDMLGMVFEALWALIDMVVI